MTILINPARFRFGADTAIGRLLGDEPVGLAVDFTTMQAIVRDDTTPVVNYLGDAGLLLSYVTSPSPKRVWGVDGLLKFAPHNFYLNSNTPANQSVTVISGFQYAVIITGATTTTLSGAATGTITAGTTVITAATTTLTFSATSGAGTIQLSRYPVHPGYFATTAAARYGIPQDYHPVTRALLGALIEGQRINLALQSQTFGTTWTALNVSVGSDAIAAPDGTTTADTLTATSVTTPGVSQAATTTAVATTFSVYAKAGTASWLRLSLTTSASETNRIAWFNLGTGVVGTKQSNVTTQTIQNCGGGWYRCAITVTTAAASETAAIRIASGDSAVDATNGTTVHLWGAQLEAGAFPTSYIPTTTATVTRAADNISLPTTAFPVNAVASTLVASGSYPQAPVTGIAASLCTLNLAGGVNKLTLIDPSDGLLYFQARNTTGIQANIVLGARTIGVSFKVAGAASANDAAGVVNGGTVFTDAVVVMPTAPDALRFGSEYTNASWMYGHLKTVTYLPRRASNAELQRMTV